MPAVKEKQSSGGNSIGASLKRKIGPLPAWAWLVLFGVGVYWYQHRAGASQSTPAAATASDTLGTGVDTSGAQQSSGGGGGGPTPDNSGLIPAASAPVSWDPGAFAAQVASDLAGQTPSYQTDGGWTGNGGTGSTPAKTGPGAAPTGPTSQPSKGTPVTPAPATRGVVLTPSGQHAAPTGQSSVATFTPSASRTGAQGPVLNLQVPAGATNVKRLPSGAITYTQGKSVIEQPISGSRYRIGKA